MLDLKKSMFTIFVPLLRKSKSSATVQLHNVINSCFGTNNSRNHHALIGLQISSHCSIRLKNTEGLQALCHFIHLCCQPLLHIHMCCNAQSLLQRELVTKGNKLSGAFVFICERLAWFDLPPFSHHFIYHLS